MRRSCSPTCSPAAAPGFSRIPAHPSTRIPGKRFETLVDQRRRGEPIAHLTGRREFWSLDLRVTLDTLIPRPETEHLVEAVLAAVRPNEAATVADIGTGAREPSPSPSPASVPGRSSSAPTAPRPRPRWLGTTRTGSAPETPRSWWPMPARRWRRGGGRSSCPTPPYVRGRATRTSSAATCGSSHAKRSRPDREGSTCWSGSHSKRRRDWRPGADLRWSMAADRGRRCAPSFRAPVSKPSRPSATSRDTSASPLGGAPRRMGVAIEPTLPGKTASRCSIRG